MAAPQANNNTAKIRAVHWLRFIAFPSLSAGRQRHTLGNRVRMNGFRVVSLFGRTLGQDGVGIARHDLGRGGKVQDKEKQAESRRRRQRAASEADKRKPEAMARFDFLP